MYRALGIMIFLRENKSEVLIGKKICTFQMTPIFASDIIYCKNRTFFFRVKNNSLGWKRWCVLWKRHYGVLHEVEVDRNLPRAGCR